MRKFEIRFCKGWDRSDVEVNPTENRIKELLNNQSLGQSCLGEVTIGCFYKTENGSPTFRNSIDLSLYLGDRGNAVVSKEFNEFLGTERCTSERKPLPIEGGEISNIAARYFVPISVAIELVVDLIENGELTGNYLWGDPNIYENIGQGNDTSQP